MKRTPWFFILIVPLVLWGGNWEVSAGGGLVFLDRQSQGVQLEDLSDNLARVWLRGAYQHEARSDQIGVTLVTDRRIDELDFSYARMLPGIEAYAPFGALPYAKLALAIGNTYVAFDTLSHFGGAIGIGVLARSQKRFRIRFELEYRLREGQLERRGADIEKPVTRWEDRELNFLVGAGVRF